MAKKKSWLSKLKRFFISETHPKPEKEKKKRWLMQRLKISRLPSLGPPPTLLLQDSTKGEAEDQQRKHDFTVAVAAHVASPVSAEVVQITDVTASVISTCEDDTQELPAIIHSDTHQSVRPYGREIQELAAIKIQTAFRGHLARKALRALKGLVKLQAIIRGRAVRRQAMSTLKCLQTMVSIQSQVCARRSQNFEETCSCHDLKDKVMKIESATQRRWDDSILTKEEANALFISKKEAALKRERIREYALSNRKSADHEQNKSNGKLRIWLEQWVDTQLAKREDLEDTSVLSSNTRIKDYGRNNKQLDYQKQYRLDGLVSPVSFSRTAFHQKKQQSSNVDNETFPTYMAATESAKAKTRSTSSPKTRQKSFDTYSEGNSPFKNKLSVMSCANSEVSSSGRMGKFDSLTYRSPSLKGFIPGPVKSGRKLKDLSFDSNCSLLNWDRYGPFR